MQGTKAPQTVKLLATSFGKKVIMLVDSGNSSFISEQLAATVLSQSLYINQVQVANGQLIACTHGLPHYKVHVQGHTIQINL